MSSLKKAKPEPKKLYAYSDGDGFIYWNIVEAGALWCKLKAEWLYRVPKLDKEYK